MAKGKLKRVWPTVKSQAAVGEKRRRGGVGDSPLASFSLSGLDS